MLHLEWIQNFENLHLFTNEVLSILNLESIQKLRKFTFIYQIMFIFKKHNFTYFLYGLFDTQNFGQEIKSRFFLNLQKKTGKKTALYYLY